MTTESILEIRDVHFAYGGVRAVDGCSFTVGRQASTGLIGPNGAGKSTLIEVVAGGLRPQSGQVLFEGEDIAGMGRMGIARRGIVRTFQLSRELLHLPVIENVMIAAQDQVGENPMTALFAAPRWRPQETDLLQRADELLAWVGLERLRYAPAGSLSGGQRRLLDIARALMARPKLLLLDEPTAGVYPALVQMIAERLKELPAMGVTLLMVAHNMGFVASVCDDVVVMAQGRMLTRGSLDEVRGNREVVQAYLGG
ncbi:MAG TPA: ABC transporter ATP-binding protein [Bacillota bacterium]|nr:ABC transporter ATP-binding protein [Bacillota bacterium]